MSKNMNKHIFLKVASSESPNRKLKSYKVNRQELYLFYFVNVVCSCRTAS
jgi:hypothetical protein